MKRRVQIQLTLMPGAEPWFRVEHATGWFKVPCDSRIDDVFMGARDGWRAESANGTRHSRGSITISSEKWAEMVLEVAQLRAENYRLTCADGVAE